MAQFLANLRDVKWGFGQIVDFFKRIFEAIKTNPDTKHLIDSALARIPSILPYAVYIMLALALIEAFFGKKLLTFQKFVICFVLGYAIGVHYVTPFVHNVFLIRSWIVGLVVGAVAAILCKVIYFLAVVLAAGYSTYIVCFRGMLLPVLTQYTQGRVLWSLIVAVVAVVILLFILKYVEMLGTSVLGGWIAVRSLNTAVAFTSWSWLSGATGVVVYWVLVGVVSLLGVAVQWRTRRRF